MVFNFYNNFFPGITVYREGFVKVDELKSIFDNIMMSNANKSDEGWEILEVRNFELKLVLKLVGLGYTVGKTLWAAQVVSRNQFLGISRKMYICFIL